MARMYLDSMTKSNVRGKRSPSIQQNKDAQRLTNQWARFYKTDNELHPGCGEFWFLPGTLRNFYNYQLPRFKIWRTNLLSRMIL